MAVWLFVLGLAVGSFLNVVTIRYEPDRFLLQKKSIGGRSRCPHCGNKLTSRELIPLLSFVLQRGRCRNCRARISFQYPVVELLTGLIFVSVPAALKNSYLLLPTTSYLIPNPYILAALWIFIFTTLLLIAVIDLRERIIPDEANVFLLILGAAVIYLSQPGFGSVSGSFLGGYALLFGLRGNIWLDHFLGSLAALLFFAAIVILTRGRGMGMGDVKLAAVLGWVFGWPDILLITALGFVSGSIVGIGSIVLQKKSMRSLMAFGPFLALGALLLFFFGHAILDAYFGLFQI